MSHTEPAGTTEHRTQMTQIAQIKTRSNQLHGPMITNESKLPFMIIRPRASRWLRIAPSRGLNEKKDISLAGSAQGAHGERSASDTDDTDSTD